MVFKILQITDTHLTPTTHLRGVPVYEQLEKVLHQTIEKDPSIDMVVFSGDIADEGSDEAYRWVKQRTANYVEKCIFMVGNHDKSEKIVKCLDLKHEVDIQEGRVTSLVEKSDFSILCLDTGENRLSTPQIDYLVKYRAELPVENQLIVFTHHPVLYMGAAFMDSKYPLGNIDEVVERLGQAKGQHFTFYSGHYHLDGSSTQGNITVHTTPSTMLQISREHAGFSIDTTAPGYRMIEIDNDYTRSYVKFIRE